MCWAYIIISVLSQLRFFTSQKCSQFNTMWVTLLGGELKLKHMVEYTEKMLRYTKDISLKVF
jgi:hypothetical protein